MSVFDRIAAIFRDAQRNSATHARGVTKMKAIDEEEDGSSEFNLAVTKCIHAFLRQDYRQKSQYVTRISHFVGVLCMRLQEHYTKYVCGEGDDPTVRTIVLFLIDMSQTPIDTVRYHACLYIHSILTALLGFSLEMETFEKLQDAMLACLQDRVIRIRVQAAIVLNPLQLNEINTSCPIIEAFVERLMADPSAQVRKVCVEKVALNRLSVGEVVLCSTDIDANVRLAVYKRAVKYPPQFKIIDKHNLIQNGFRDTSLVIKKYIAQEVLPAWLNFFEFDYLRFLKALRLDSNWDDLTITIEVSEYVLNALFQVRPTTELLSVLTFDENRFVPIDELTWETVLYWRVFLEHLRKMNPDGIDGDDYIIQIPVFCKYVEAFCELSMEKINISQDTALQSLEFNFTIMQLFEIANLFDFSDITCQQCTNDLIANVLKAYLLDFEVLNVVITTFNKSMPNVNRQTSYICDLLGDLLCPSLPIENHLPHSTPGAQNSRNSHPEEACANILDTTQQQYQVAQLKVKYYTLSAELEKALKEENYHAAADLNVKIKEVKAEINAHQLPAVAAEEDIVEVAEDEDIDMDDMGKEDECKERDLDPVIITRAMNIMAAFLKTSKLRSLPVNLAAFKMNHIDEMIQSTNWHVRIAAMKCLAFCCILDERTANTSIGTFCGLLMKHNDNSSSALPYELIHYAAGTIIDCLLKYGANLFANVTDGTILSASINEEAQEIFSGGYSLSSIVRELLHLLNDDNSKLQEVAGIGVCNLILMGRVQSHGVLSRLILKYITPGKTDTPTIRLQQYIGVMLQRLPTIPNAAHQYVRAIIPALKVVVKAPVSNSLRNIDLDATNKLLISICSTFAEGKALQMELAAALLSELKKKPNGEGSIEYSKMLLRLEYDTSEKEQIKAFAKIIDKLRNRNLDKKVDTILIKLNTRLTLALEGRDNTVEEEVQEESDDSDL